MLDNICSGKNLKRLTIILLVLVLLYLLWPKLKELWYTKFLIAREGYEDIVLIVKSKCPSDSYFNSKLGKCIQITDVIRDPTNPQQLISQLDPTFKYIELATTGITNDWYDGNYTLGKAVYSFPNSDLSAVPYVFKSGQRATTIPFSYTNDSAFNTISSLTLFITRNRDKVLEIIRTNNTSYGLTSILGDTTSTLTNSMVVEQGKTPDTFILKVLTTWTSPNIVDTTECKDFEPTTRRYINYRFFNATIPSGTPAPGITYNTRAMQNALDSGKYPTTTQTRIAITCRNKIDCQAQRDTTKQIEGSVVRKSADTYDFIVKIPYIINRFSNDEGSNDTTMRLCSNPNVITYDAFTTGDTVVATPTPATTTGGTTTAIGTALLTKTFTITYNTTPVIDTAIGSSDMQLLVKRIQSPTTPTDAMNWVNANAPNLFPDFFGDISRLPVLTLFTIPTTTMTTNKVINGSYNDPADNGDGTVLTTIIGRRYKDSTSDLNLTDVNTQSLIKSMVNTMTGFAVNDISEIRGIFPTIQISNATSRLYATNTASGLQWKTISTITGEDNNLALWSIVPSPRTTGNVIVLQHIMSGYYLNVSSTAPRTATLVEMIDSATPITSTFDITKADDTAGTTGTIRAGTDSINVGTNNTVVFNANTLSYTAKTTAWSSTAWSLNTVLDLINDIRWNQINLSATAYSSVIPGGIVQYASSDGNNKLAITYSGGKGIFSTNDFNNGNVITSITQAGNTTQTPPVQFGEGNFAFLETSSLKTISIMGVDSKLYWADVSTTNIVAFGGSLGNNVLANNTSSFKSQFQLARSGNFAFYMFVGGGSPTPTLYGQFFTNTDWRILITSTVLGSSPMRFNVWGNNISNNGNFSITFNTDNGQLFYIPEINNAGSIDMSSLRRRITLPSGIRANWVSHDDKYCIIVDQNGLLYFTRNIAIPITAATSTYNPEWFPISIPTSERVSTVDLKNRNATIVTVSGKVFVSNIFIK